jgi:hypothetical protein
VQQDQARAAGAKFHIMMAAAARQLDVLMGYRSIGGHSGLLLRPLDIKKADQSTKIIV